MKTLKERTELRAFRAEDMLFLIGDGLKEKNVQMYGNKNLKELAEQTEIDDLSITGFVDGVMVGCGGIRKMWDGVGEVWLMLSPEVNRFPIRTGAVIFNGMRALIEDNDFTRLQGWCRVDFPQAHTLFRHLGFKAEGMAESYTPDECDCILYGLVNKREA
jgi:hypothetical protein